jgi:AcrR family transcriptional regulator
LLLKICSLNFDFDLYIVRYINDQFSSNVNHYLLISMKKNIARRRGRPITFERNEVLDRAVIVFWAKGYSGASLDDLTEAMAISRPSLYSAFGNKHNLYLEAIKRYGETLGTKPPASFFAEPKIENAVAAFFSMTIQCATDMKLPRGCLVANVASDDAGQDRQVQAILTDMFSAAEFAFTNRMAQARDDGELPENTNPGALARLVISASHSIAVRARIGARPKALEQISQDFMAILFPSSN